jgi:hypothetical protein
MFHLSNDKFSLTRLFIEPVRTIIYRVLIYPDSSKKSPYLPTLQEKIYYPKSILTLIDISNLTIIC